MTASPLSDIEELLAATGEHLAAENTRVGIVWAEPPSTSWAS